MAKKSSRKKRDELLAKKSKQQNKSVSIAFNDSDEEQQHDESRDTESDDEMAVDRTSDEMSSKSVEYEDPDEVNKSENEDIDEIAQLEKELIKIEGELHGLDPDSETDEHDKVKKPPKKKRKPDQPKQTKTTPKPAPTPIPNRQARSPLLAQIKQLWEQLRQKNISPSTRSSLLSNLLQMIMGKIGDLVLKHDASRVVQTLLKFGSKEQRGEVAKALKGKYAELAKSTYGKFLVCKILNPQHRDDIIKEFYGQVRKLIKHKEASEVIEEAYSVGKATHRSGLMQEFYGPEFVFFKTPTPQTLSEILSASPHKKDIILKNLAQSISSILDKGTIKHSITHRALLDYFTNANEKQLADMIVMVGEKVPEILHTREGSKVAMLCVAHGTPKNRKVIIKSMKTYINKICCDEYGHLVLLTVFDAVDDTTLVENSIIKEIGKNLQQIIEDKYGHRVILYLLVGRSQIILSKGNIELLASMDEIRAKTSQELLKAISSHLIPYCESNTQSLLSHHFGTQVLCETMLHAQGDKTQTLLNIATLARGSPRTNPDHIMLSMVNRTLKTLVQGGHYRVLKKDKSTEKVGLHFGKMLMDAIREHLVTYAKGATSSFVILALLHDEDVGEEVRQTIIENAEDLRNHASELGVKLLLEETGAEVAKPHQDDKQVGANKTKTSGVNTRSKRRNTGK
ncbi:9898_t:CDS:2 [Paraglomus brasilianum]|uniref:9898_t:CDS:1 n=1 Tax=Paraglomus brasilianum TaxID=144538 RepID=A0A9N9B7G8_9GLOM|nr:9898_t:CDS:2 [Paraglomus brasilianum]